MAEQQATTLRDTVLTLAEIVFLLAAARQAAAIVADQVDGPWPLLRLIGENLAVVGVNSARPNPLPWRSSGHFHHCYTVKMGESGQSIFCAGSVIMEGKEGF